MFQQKKFTPYSHMKNNQYDSEIPQSDRNLANNNRQIIRQNNLVDYKKAQRLSSNNNWPSNKFNQQLDINYQKSNQSMYVQDSYTNNVFSKQYGNKTIFYIPAYLRMKLNSITSLNLKDLTAEIFTDLYLNIYYGNLQEQINQKIRSSGISKSKHPFILEILKKLSNSIILSFSHNCNIKLQNDDIEIITQKYPERKQIKFTINKRFNLRIQPDIIWSPFQIINLILSVNIEPLIIYEDPENHESRKYCFQFNLMDHKNSFLKLSYGKERKYGHYQMAVSFTDVVYTNLKDISMKEFRIYKQNQNNKSQHENLYVDDPLYLQPQVGTSFSYAHFNVPYYKHPILPLLIVFVPLWLLSTISLAIFFQNENLGTRIISISILILAFIALLPTIRSIIPTHNRFTFIQIMAYLQMISSFLCLLHSLDVRQKDNFQLKWYATALFWISGTFLFLNILFVVIMMLLYLLYWKPSYEKFPSKKQLMEQFDRRSWRNKKCDNYFEKIVKQFKRRISKQKL